MALFSPALVEQINSIAAKSNEQLKPAEAVNTRSMNDDLNKMSKQVMDYFKDSPAILITTKKELHDYVDECIKKGYAGIDTETTGLDRIKDWIVGASLYTPGLPECYIPIKHMVPIFETLYKDQLTYEEVQEEFQRLVDNKVRLIFANADFDLAMIYKDLHVDMIPAFYYDVLLAWRCIKENELDNSLKGLYAKYPMKGKVDPKKFSDFFSPTLFPYCKPQVAKLYAANDAKITYDLFLWQLPYVTKDSDKCKKHNLERIANLVWNIEFPMVSVCALLHRRGVYLDDSIASPLHERYTGYLHKDEKELSNLVQELIDTRDIASNRNRPFRTGSDFNPNSQPHVKYLVNKLLGSEAKSTGKDILKEINQPVTNAVLKVRGDVKLIGTYVDKLPRITGADHRVHASFKSVGAATGRMCIAEGMIVSTPNGPVEIQKIKPGQKVYCADSDKIVASKVLNVWETGKDKKCVVISRTGKQDLICTPEHPIGTRYGWKEASQLQPGDKIISISESYKLVEDVISSVEESEETYTVYDLEIETYHHFIANDILVHNSSESPNAQNIPSKAHDIRHMFRAAPEITRTVNLKPKEGSANLILSKYSSVETSQGQFTKVHLLKEDDHIISGTQSFKIDKLHQIESDESSLEIQMSVPREVSELQLTIVDPPYCLLSSDFSQQEPKITATVSQDRRLVDAFINGKDVYATIASIALHVPYEECLEFHPVTGELQPEGKARRSVGKVLNLGITYGMSVQSIAESLFSDRDDMTDEEKIKEGQKIQDSLMKGFPDLANAIKQSQIKATKLGYTETILGRRRHHPNMQLPRYEFVPMAGYVNPDIDPLDPESLKNKEQIPKRIVDALTKEFNSLKYYGKIVKRTKELAEQKIKVINNSYKIEEATRQVFNSIIQGSAAELTKMAMLKLENDPEWKEIGGRFLIPVHDELICEVPLENAKKGSEVLARCMCDSGSFLPFKLTCDVECTYRWYGLSVEDIESREKPENLDWDNLSQSNIEWIQAMLVENEYLLPVFKEEDGSKPSGVRAQGINGKITDELKQYVKNYMDRYELKTDEEFLNHIEVKVTRGVIKR